MLTRAAKRLGTANIGKIAVVRVRGGGIFFMPHPPCIAFQTGILDPGRIGPMRD